MIAGAKDEAGLHFNTEETDCEVCKCDLWLNAIISPACPGKATCSEHAAALPCAKEEQILLYRWGTSIGGGKECQELLEALCVHGVVKQAFAETCTPVQSLTASDSCRLEAGCQAVLDSLQQYSYCHEVAVFFSSTKSVTAWCCRHSLEELQQLVDSAVRCIEGTQETIDSAIRRKTDPVSALELSPTLRLHWMHCTPEC